MTRQGIVATLRAFADRLANLKDEAGGMMFSGLISCVGLTALSVFAINVCSEALERERMQNAADASAYASATWFARGMNALTSLNHQLGEKTAYTIVAEAMAGPEPTNEISKEEREMNDLLHQLKTEAPDETRSSEHPVVNSLINDLENCKIGGGALYDARMRLKYGQTIVFNTKARMNSLQKASRKYLKRGDLTIVAQEKHKEKNAQEDPDLVSGHPSKLSEILQKISDGLQKGQDFLNDVKDMVQSLNDELNEVKSYLWGDKSVQASLRQIANEVRAADQTVANLVTEEFKQTKQYQDFQKNVEALKKELAELENNLLKDIQFNIGNVQVTLKTKDVTEEMINKATTEVDFIREAIETIRVETERIQNKLKREYERILAPIRELEEKTAREIERIAGQIDSWFKGVKELADKATQALDKVKKGLDTAINYLATAKEIVDQINDLISGKKPISALISTLSGHNMLHIEWKGLLELEKEITNATNGVVKVKNELRQGIETISKELTTVAGADKKATAERSVVKLINDGANKLLKKYGVSVCVVSPLDGAAKEDAASSTSNASGSSKSSATKYGLSSSSPNSDPVPTLPVLAEAAPIVKPTATKNLGYVRNKAWTGSGAYSSPYDKLPPIPWNGDDNSNYIEKIKSSDEEAVIYAYSTGMPHAIALMGHWRTWYRGIRAAHYLDQMLSRGRRVKSSWKNDRYGFRNNPSVWSYPTEAFSYDSEKVSQWVRATYPALDELRARIRQNYHKKLKESNFTTYFIAWTYRYALSESYYCRSGMKRPYAGKGGNYVANEPASMCVIPGTDPLNKGNEPMWTDPKEREKTIDKYFTVTATVQKTRPPIGNVKLFKRLGAEKGTAAIAEAFVYPANGRNEQLALHRVKIRRDELGKLQPFTAWDTLGWKNLKPGRPPEFAAQEWETQPTLDGGKLSYTDVMKKKTLPGTERTAVEFTWNACMCPVTESKLRRLANNKEDADDALRAAAKSAAENASVVSQ